MALYVILATVVLLIFFCQNISCLSIQCYFHAALEAKRQPLDLNCILRSINVSNISAVNTMLTFIRFLLAYLSILKGTSGFQ